MSNSIINISDQEYNRASLLATDFGTSGLFPNIRNKAQAMVMITIGREIGVSAIAAMTGIHLISGKPVIGANLMAERIKATGKYDYDVLELTDQVCRLQFFRLEGTKKSKVGVSEFTLEDAKKAQLLGKPNSNWAKYPKNMLFARALSNGQRWYCPDVFNGTLVYTPDEMGAVVNDSGELDPKANKAVIEATATVKEAPKYDTLSEGAIASIRSIISTAPNPDASAVWIAQQIGSQVKESYSLLEEVPAKYEKAAKAFAQKIADSVVERQKKLSELHANLEKFNETHQLDHDVEIARAWLRKRAGVESMTELTLDAIKNLLAYVKKTVATQDVDEDYYVFYSKAKRGEPEQAEAVDVLEQDTFPTEIVTGSRLIIGEDMLGIITSISNDRTVLSYTTPGNENKEMTVQEYQFMIPEQPVFEDHIPPTNV